MQHLQQTKFDTEYTYIHKNGHTYHVVYRLSDINLLLFSSQNHEKYIRETRFGFYWYDGSVQGRPKPIAYCTRFLTNYLLSTDDFSLSKASITFQESSTPIHASYVFKSADALFIGNVSYSSPSLSFQLAKHSMETCTNYMMYWNTTCIHLITSADTDVQLNPYWFVPQISTSKTNIHGMTGGIQWHGKIVYISCLRGSPVVISS